MTTINEDLELHRAHLDRDLALRDDLDVRAIGTESIAWSRASTTPLYLHPAAELLRQTMGAGVTGHDLVEDVIEVFGLEREVAEMQIGAVIGNFDMHGLFVERVDHQNIGAPMGGEFLRRGGDG